MIPLNDKQFPHAGMRNLRFKTKDGVVHTGRYDFNDTWARRWFDEDNKEYTSDIVEEWEVMMERYIKIGEIEYVEGSEMEMEILNAIIEKEGFSICSDNSYNTPRYIIMKKGRR